MLNVNEVWARVSQLPQFRGKTLDQFVIQAWDLNVSLGSNAGASGTVDNQPVTFAAGAIILGMAGAARPNGQTALQTYPPGNDLYQISISDAANNRSIVGRAKAIATSVFGVYNDLFPAKEIIVPLNNSLNFGFQNMTSTALDITITSHILVPAAVS
jgi:hypothetical protein